jgi:hypothetical protein
MNQPSAEACLQAFVIACAGACAFAATLARATPAEPVAPAVQGIHADPQARYERERAACLSGHSPQDRDTCLKEAGAALQAARRGDLTSGAGELKRNARERCNVLAGDERRDCLARMRGEGTVSGSVEAGGILREKVTVVPAPAPVASGPR